MSAAKKNAKLRAGEIALRVGPGEKAAKVAVKKKPGGRRVEGKTSLTGAPSTQKDPLRQGRPAAREAPGPPRIPDGAGEN